MHHIVEQAMCRSLSIGSDAAQAGNDPKFREGIMDRLAKITLMTAVSGIALTNAISTGAVAQDATAGRVIEVIEVTAQRRSENLQDVPISVSVLTNQRMEDLAIQDTTDIFKVTPSVTLQNSNGFLNPRIRGVGSTSAGPGVENSVAVYIDGVYIASSPATFLSLSSVERVEVLKGPQGTLFGRNATGGLIQVVTKDRLGLGMATIALFRASCMPPAR